MSNLTIDIDIGNYNAVKIVYKQATSGNVIHIKECIVGSNTTLSQTFAYDTSYPITYSREVKISSDSISVLNGYAQGGSAAGASKSNSAVCIPTHIYGCKL